MENETMLNVEENQRNVKVLKCPPGLAKLNSLVKMAQVQIVAGGHESKRFKRDYSTGTARYTCPECNLEVVVSLDSSSVPELPACSSTQTVDIF